MQAFANTRVIVVDNGSTDGSLAVIRQADPNVIVVENATNTGYAAGHNYALHYGLQEGFDYFWLLNYDTTLESGTLAALVDLAESDHVIGAISPVIFTATQREQIQFCGTWSDVGNYNFHNARDLADLDAHQLDGAGDLLLWGTALFLSGRAIEAAGFLDERYFAYYEDLDLTDRILKAGFRTRVCNNARIWHGGDNSIFERPPYYVYFNIRNQYLYWSERRSVLAGLRHLRLFAKRTLRLLIKLQERSEFERLEAGARGFMDALLGRYGPWENSTKTPRWFYVFATTHPHALLHLLDGRLICFFSGVFAYLRNRLSVLR